MESAHFQTQLAIEEDLEEIWELIQQFCNQTYQSSPRSVGKKELLQDGFGEKRHFQYIVVKEMLPENQSHQISTIEKHKGNVIAVASFFYLYSTWEGLFLFIDDFLVSLKHQELKVDMMLLNMCAKIALEKDCCRVQFFAHREDSLTREKYTNLGAICLPEWLTVRLPNLAMRKFANEDNIIAGKFSIRSATKEDVKSIIYLIQLLAEIENEPNAVLIDEEVLLKDGFGKESYFQCFVGETLEPVSEDKSVMNGDTSLPSTKMLHNPKIAGMALYLTIYCKRKGKILHLEDLFVKEEHRNQGLGTALMKECAKVGLTNGCNEMDWQVLDWNTKAIDLYKRIGGIIDEDYKFMRFRKTDISVLANDSFI